jgi:trimethylamine:corrinoid methyltransferase-like protein
MNSASSPGNPNRSLSVGGRNCIFSSVGGPAYVMDLDRGRRAGTYREMCDYLKVVQSLNVIHQEGGGPFEPLDLPAETRHLDLYYAEITLLDKNWQPQGLGRGRALDALEMAAISLGTTRENLPQTPLFTAVINTNSPLQLDVPMAEGLITFAEHGQCNVITPFTLAGAMSPVTLAGALVQQHAEALAGIALAQVVRPGVPVMYGGFTSKCRYEVRRSCLRNARVHPGRAGLRAAGTAHRRALPVKQRHRRERRRCAGGLRKLDVLVGFHHGRRQHGDARRGLAWGRTDGVLRKTHH